MLEVETTCPYCGVGCGLTVKVDSNKLGNRNGSSLPLMLASPNHPANEGRLCSKGSALAQTIEHDSKRLLIPMVDGQDVGWDEASTVVAQRIQDSISEHGKDSVAFYLSGQLLTEDYYLANKLMKGFIGTANVDTNSRLCMSSAVAAYKRAFGADAVPCSYEDIDVADLIVLIGSNAAWTHPVLYQRMQAAKDRNPKLKIVLVDPRKPVTADIADFHLQLRPGSDGFLLQGLLNYLIENEYINQSYIEQHTEDFEYASSTAQQYSLQIIADETDLSVTELREFFELFGNTDKVLSFYSQGINQSATGTDKCNAIINCHLATGKLGYAGAGPFSITGQPNAMGGREVGGMANMLAAHMDFTSEDTARVQRFWRSPSIAQQPGLKAVDLFQAVHDGKIKVLWIMATNPAVSLPDSNFVREALEKCDTVIVSDVTQTDTTQYAQVLLPALAWGEKDGTVTNSERCISRQRSFMQGPGLTKPDWWAIAQVAKKMGFEAFFNHQSSYEVFTEHAALSGFENHAGSKRCFDISRLASLDKRSYDQLQPIQWPVNSLAPKGTKRLFANGDFFTESGKAQFVSAPSKHAQAVIVQQSLEQHSKDINTQDKTFLLNSGRLRDQWHTMTRTGNAPSLTTHNDTPTVEIHPSDALLHSIEQGDYIELSNSLGRAILQAKITKEVSKGQLFAPIHWSDQFSSLGVVNRLMPQFTDAVSGQPESKVCAVNLKKFAAEYWTKIATRQRLADHPSFAYWASHKTAQGYVTLIASHQTIDAASLVDNSAGLKVSHYTNPISGFASGVLSESDDITHAAYFCSKLPTQLPSSFWLLNVLLAKTPVATTLRGEQGDPDTLVCACFGTSRKAIEDACAQSSMTQAKLAEMLGCGSKCGSCKPELNILLRGDQHDG